MRIGFDRAAAGRAPGGVRRYTESLAAALAARARQEGEGGEATWEILEGSPAGRLPLAKYAAAWRSRRLAVDLLHLPNSYAPWFATSFGKIVTVHDLTPILFPWGHTWRNVLHHRLMLARIIKASDHLIAVSQAVKRDLVRWGVPAEKITVVYEAAAPAFFASAPRDPARPGKHLLFVGAREPRKNLPGLLSAYAILRRVHGVRWPLVIAGPSGWGPRGDKGKEAAEGVVWKGFVSEAELLTLYRDAALFFYPSYYEGFGLPVLEAMAAGTPVVTSERGALGEVAGSAALYANPASSVEIAQAAARILSDRQLWSRLSEKGRARARLFSWDEAARKTWEVYRKVLAVRRQGKPLPLVSRDVPLEPPRRASGIRAYQTNLSGTAK